MQSKSFEILRGQLADTLSPELRRNAARDLSLEPLSPEQRLDVLADLLDPIGWGGLHDPHPHVRERAADLALQVLGDDPDRNAEVARIAASWVAGNDIDLGLTGSNLILELPLDEKLFGELLSTAIVNQSPSLACLCSGRKDGHLESLERLLEPLIEALRVREMQFFAVEMLTYLAQCKPELQDRVGEAIGEVATNFYSMPLAQECAGSALAQLGEDSIIQEYESEDMQADSSAEERADEERVALQSFDHARFEPVLYEGGISAVLENCDFQASGADFQIRTLHFLIRKVRDNAEREEILAAVVNILESCYEADQIFYALDALEAFEGHAWKILPYVRGLAERIEGLPDGDSYARESVAAKLLRVQEIIEWSYVPEVA